MVYLILFCVRQFEIIKIKAVRVIHKYKLNEFHTEKEKTKRKKKKNNATYTDKTSLQLSSATIKSLMSLLSSFDNLYKAFIRPPRQSYQEADLGKNRVLH